MIVFVWKVIGFLANPSFFLLVHMGDWGHRACFHHLVLELSEQGKTKNLSNWLENMDYNNHKNMFTWIGVWCSLIDHSRILGIGANIGKNNT